MMQKIEEVLIIIIIVLFFKIFLALCVIVS